MVEPCRIIIEKDLRHRNEPDFVPASFFFFVVFSDGWTWLQVAAGWQVAGCGLGGGPGAWDWITRV